MSKKCLVGLLFAALFLVAANAKADMVTVYGNQAEFNSNVATSDWGFTAVTQRNKDPNGISSWTFEISNNTDDAGGELKATGFTGDGSNANIWSRLSVDFTLQATHNKANTFEVIFDGETYIDSFWVNFDPFTSWDAINGINFKAWYVDADDNADFKTWSFDQYATEAFFGVALDPEYYLTKIQWTIDQTGNNGYLVTMGFGGEKSATPEPATLAILGMGLAGLGIARRRMKK